MEDNEEEFRQDALVRRRADLFRDPHQHQHQQQAAAGGYLAILDEEEWFKQYGLRGEPHYGAESYMNQQEAKERIQRHQDYQSMVHAKVFQKEQQALEDQVQRRQLQLDQWKDRMITIHSMPSLQEVVVEEEEEKGKSSIEETPLTCNLCSLARHSDTVFTMAKNQVFFEASIGSNNTSSSTSSNTATTMKISSSNELHLSLSRYTRAGVHAFLEWIQRNDTTGSDEATTRPETACTTTTTATQSSLYPPPEDHVIECCQIAHYLQCNDLLNSLVPLLIESVDEANALSLFELADQLHLPSLREKSLDVLLASLQRVEDHDIWEDLSEELQSHIRSIQGILRHTNRTKVFFGSLPEYLALFAEQVDYYKERLEAAERAQASFREGDKGPAWEYAQTKIDLQRQRVQTLKAMLQEQKRIFRP